MKKKKKKATGQPTHRSPVDADTREHMVAVLIRNPTAFQAVRDQLTSDKLSSVDVGLGLVWTVVRRLYDQHATLPAKGMLLAEIKQAVAEDQGSFEDEIDSVEKFVAFAFNKKIHGEDLATSETQADWGITTARKFLEDQLSFKVRRTVNDHGKLPADLPVMLRTMTQEADDIASLQSKSTAVPFPTGWDKGQSHQLFPTGISVFDRFLGGGHKGGETYLFMGPYGTCKSTVAVMGLVEGARQAAALTAEADWDGREPLSVIVSYETPIEELRERCLSYGALIPRDRAEQVISEGEGLDYLSASDERLDYEHKLFKAKLQAGEQVKPERKRAEEIIELLNRHAVFIDMTGADPERRGAGNGYVPEVARSLDNELRQRKNAYILVVWLDYLGAMAKRHIEAQERDYSDLRHLVSGGVLHLGAQVALPFECPVWVMHQFSGAANSRGPTAKMHHTDGAEAKNVAENASFAVVTGNLTENRLCVFDCTKHRRQPPRKQAVVRVDGLFNRIRDVSKKYAVDRDRREILSKKEMEGQGAYHSFQFAKASKKHDSNIGL